MSQFPIHTEANHPPHAAETLTAVKAKYGFVPNLLGAMSESPEAAAAYLALGDAMAKSSFTPTERHVVWFTINTYHQCHYCMAAHTGIAKREQIADDVIATAREGGDYADPKLQALKTFVLTMVESRGWPQPADLEAFYTAGYTQRSVLDVILAISHKVLSNYTNHVVETPVDEPFTPFVWSPRSAAAE